MPMRAHSCGKGALISVIVYAAIVVLYLILFIAGGSCAACVALGTQI